MISYAVAVWLVTTIGGGVRIARGLRLLVRLKQQSQPFDAGRQARLTMWTSVRQSGRRPELRVADVACGACALGLGRPMILVSRGLLNGLADEELDQIVMHEDAHLARFDDWSRLAQAIIVSVAGLHPAVRYINRQIDLDREAACDDRVVSRTGAARQYAACLADAAAVSVGSFEAAVIPSAIGSSRMLLARVGRLLEPQRLRTTRLARAVCCAGVLLFVGILIASKDVTPVVTFLESRPAAAPDAVAPPPLRVRQPANLVRVNSSQARPAFKRSPQLSTTSPPAVGASMEQTYEVPAAPLHVSLGRTVQALETPPPIAGNRLELAYGTPAPPDMWRPPPAPAIPVTSSGDAPWTRAVDAGMAIGGGAKRSGVAIGGFFTRAGKAIAKTF
ncbi:MAG: M56 family metallopeptidase [Vicinamibacterales bacterium]